jgi:hypothetical protein
LFKENQNTTQPTFFKVEDDLPDSKKKIIEKSWAPMFHRNVFLKINEKIFKPLYHNGMGRTNTPVNQLVSLEIIKEMFDYSDEQLIEGAQTDLRIMRAIGISSLQESSPCSRTLYYFRKALVEYEIDKGDALIERVFEDIRDAMIQLTKVKTGLQRTDTFHINSNIKQLSRGKIFHKVIKNFIKILSEKEHKRIPDLLTLVKDDEDKAMYRMKVSEYKKKLQEYMEAIYLLIRMYKNHKKIKNTKQYKHLERVLKEHGKIHRKNVKLIDIKEISADSLQNPADDEAIYNNKNGSKTRGYRQSVSETCDPENKIQLLTDISNNDNNKTDDKIAAERVKKRKEQTGLEEDITDGGFEGEDTEKAYEEASVKFVPTEVKGRKQKNSITTADFLCGKNGKIKACPKNHRISSIDENDNRIIIKINKKHCASCELKQDCPVKEAKKCYFLRTNNRQIKLDVARKKMNMEEFKYYTNLRPPVEGAVAHLKPKYLKGRSRFRGKKKIGFRLYYRAVMVNFRRIWVYINNFYFLISQYFLFILKYLLQKRYFWGEIFK